MGWDGGDILLYNFTPGHYLDLISVEQEKSGRKAKDERETIISKILMGKILVKKSKHMSGINMKH